jgi:hypothetical protein
MTTVKGEISRKRFSKTCCLCNKLGAGICIDCDFRACNKGMHINCAIEAGLIGSVIENRSRTDQQNKNNIGVFCHNHREISELEIQQFGFKFVVKQDRFEFPKEPTSEQEM